MMTRTNILTKALVIALLLVLIGAGLWYFHIIRFQTGTWVPRVGFGRQTGELPRMDRPVHFAADFPAEARIVVEGKISADRAVLAKNPHDPDALLDLAIQYKIAGDLPGTIEIWQYMTETIKSESVPYHNLGSVYHLELKEYEKSEQYYRQAIDVNPAVAINYVGLHELYRYSYKQDTTAAIDILQEGLGKVDIRGQVDLYTTLGGYYTEKGDKAAARAAYEKARALAQELGNTGLVSNINAELTRLKK